jgi:hypothetical protein
VTVLGLVFEEENHGSVGVSAQEVFLLESMSFTSWGSINGFHNCRFSGYDFYQQYTLPWLFTSDRPYADNAIYHVADFSIKVLSRSLGMGYLYLWTSSL